MANQDLYVGAANGDGVRRFDGMTGTARGDFTFGGQPMGGYSCPVFGPAGDLYVKEWSYTGAIWRFDGATGAYKATIVQSVSCAGSAIAFGPDGSLYVAGPYSGPNRIDRYDPLTGQFLGTFVPPGSGGLSGIQGMRFGPDNRLYVRNVDYPSGTFNVLRYETETGAFLDEFVTSGSGGVVGVGDLLFGPDGKLYLSDEQNNVIRRYDAATGRYIDNLGPHPELKHPFGLAFGPDSNLYVASSGTDSVVRFDPRSAAFIDTFASPTDPVPVYMTFGRRPSGVGAILGEGEFWPRSPYESPLRPDLPRMHPPDARWPWPPGPPWPPNAKPWLQQYVAALLLAESASHVSADVRSSVLEAAARQMSISSSALKEEMEKARAAKSGVAPKPHSAGPASRPL